MELKQSYLLTYSYGQREPEDNGVAVYFNRKGKQQCIPCDKWDKITDNLHAVGLTISALRGLDRWGAKEMVDAAFTGFKALPDNTGIPLFFDDCSNNEELRERYLVLVKELHPDTGGDGKQFAEMQRQYDEQIKTLA